MIDFQIFLAITASVVGIIALLYTVVQNMPKITMSISEEVDDRGTYLLMKIENSRSKILIKNVGILLPKGEIIHGINIRGSTNGDNKLPISLSTDSSDLLISFFPQDLRSKLEGYGYNNGKIKIFGYFETSRNKRIKARVTELDIDKWKKLPDYKKFIIMGANRNW